MARLFGTDGIRGVANTEELSPELAFAVGQAVVAHFAVGSRPRAVIGRDTRASGPLLEAALVAGICAAGGDVIRLGVVPTPAVAYLTRELEAQFAIMISASHNPPEYNGIKVFSADGFKLPDEVEDEIEALVRGGGPALPSRPTGAGVGRVTDAPGAVERYVDHVVASLPAGGLAGLKVVIDAGHGAAFQVGPALFRRLGADVIVINDQPDGLNINVGCGSTDPAQLAAAVVANGAAVGFAYDGDADRVIAVDEQGAVIDGDQMMCLCALDLHRRGQLKGDLLVGTVMSNLGLKLAMGRAGIRFAETQVGDRYVLEEMRQRGAVLGGEQAGHIIFLEHNTTGDGPLTAVQVASVIKRSGRPLSALAGQMQRLPQVLVNVQVKSKVGWQENKAIQGAMAAAEAELGANGRLLVRPSGTEPLIRVMAEGPEQEQLNRLASQLAEVIKAELG